jgi:hypothetical protein
MFGNYFFEVTEQSVIDTITKEFQGNAYTWVGTAFHSIVETGKPKTEKVAAGERTFLYYGRKKAELVPEGRKFDIDGNEVILDIPQCKIALDYRNEHINAFHEVRLYKDYGEAVVTGCADMIDALEIRDIKTKYSYPADQDYIDSAQWRLYLDIFNADVFHFDLFEFENYDLNKHGCDVRGLPIHRHDPITCYRYPKMREDIDNLLYEFLKWAKARNLIQYLHGNE